jgi:hypothetical protein
VEEAREYSAVTRDAGKLSKPKKPEAETVLPEHHSPVRAIVAAARGQLYTAFENLVAARAHPDGALVFEGDCGGMIYLTVPARLVACDEDTLVQLLADIDDVCWGDSSGAGLYFEALPVGSSVAGGMGGGHVVEGVWLHADLEALLLRPEVVAVLAGRSGRLSQAARAKRA